MEPLPFRVLAEGRIGRDEMDREAGFIVIHRRILSSPVYRSLSAEQRSVLLILLLKANWKDVPIMFGGDWQIIRRGELFHSLASIAEIAGVGVRVVRTTIERLSADDSAIGGNGPFLTTRRLCAKSDKAADKAADKAPRVITICKYDEYQRLPDSSDKAADKAPDIEPTQARHRPDIEPTPREPYKPEEPPQPDEPVTAKALSTTADRAPVQSALALEPTASKPDPRAEQARQVFAHWCERMKKGGRTAFDDKRRRAVEARLRDGYSVADLCRAIDGCALTPHNMGQNDRGQRYDDLELVCRDAAHVDRFIANAENPPKVKAGGFHEITEADRKSFREDVGIIHDF